jgi:hypothetical protein
VTTINSIALSALPAVYDQFAASPIGALVQCRPRTAGDSDLVVGLRGDVMDIAYSKMMPGIVLLDGEARGTYKSVIDLVHPGAMDVSNLLTINVRNPAPQPANYTQSVGTLYVDAATLKVYMWSHFPRDHLWVCVSDPQGSDRGQCAAALDITRFVELGEPMLAPIERPD